MNESEAIALYNQAHLAGMIAGNACNPTPMGVYNANPITGQPLSRVCIVPDGVCGFAWIKIKGNDAFGRAMKKNGKASPAHDKGLTVWVSDFGQSMQRKIAYANAFANVLEQNGVWAFADDRMD